MGHESERPSMPQPSRRTAFTALALAVVSSGVLVTIGLMSFVGNKVPQSVTDPLGRTLETNVVSQIFRQGWGFFTRDAREDMVSVARLDDAVWRTAGGQAMSSSENSFGLSRTARLIEQDVGYILASLPEDSEWIDCIDRASLTSCLQDLDPAAAVSISPIDADFCGSVALVRQTPVPFAYREFDVDPPIGVLRVTLLCSVEGR